MTKTKDIALIILVSIAIFFFALWVMNSTQKAVGSAPTGMRALEASSTVKVLVGSSSPITIFAANTGCTSRVITTKSANINITFATSSDLSRVVFPTEDFGHYQAASTTVSYDSGIYGCGVWQAYGFEVNSRTPSTTISVTEFQGFR